MTVDPRQANGGAVDRPRPASDEELLELVQRQTFLYFWDGLHPECGMAFDRDSARRKVESPIATGGTGMGVMAMIVAAERGWVRREDAVARIAKVLTFLEKADRHRGMFTHFYTPDGQEFNFWDGDGGGDVVETAFLMAGLLSARQYFTDNGPAETSLRERIEALWRGIEWDWYTGGEDILIWHWGKTIGWGYRHRIHGWDECLIGYVLAASSPTHPIHADAYHKGWTAGRAFRNEGEYYGHKVQLGPAYGGPLFFSHFPFLGLCPRGLKDRYADYWQQVTSHALVHYEHAVRNPNGFKGYGPDCWGFTSSDGDNGYAAHAPDLDTGVIAPTAALASFPYTPEQSMRALKHYYYDLGDRLWDRYGFVDAFNLTADWFATDHLAIDQGPIVIMIENHRTGLIWRLFMSCPEVQEGLDKLGFEPRPSI
jgi:hypothetical protein